MERLLMRVAATRPSWQHETDTAVNDKKRALPLSTITVPRLMTVAEIALKMVCRQKLASV